jgi:molecular chaperone GrpE
MRPTDRPSGPAPQGAPPTGGPPPDGGPSPAGPSPSGHPTTSADDRTLLVDDSGVEEAEKAVVGDIRQLARERDEYRELAQRIQADFENYKKRILKQQTEHLERAAETLVDKLLPVLDTFDLARAHGEGLDRVHAALVEVLSKEGLERIDPVGEAFDPNEHDAVAHEEGEGDATVSEVMRAGYRWKGRVLRPAMVKVKG